MRPSFMTFPGGMARPAAGLQLDGPMVQRVVMEERPRLHVQMEVAAVPGEVGSKTSLPAKDTS